METIKLNKLGKSIWVYKNLSIERSYEWQDYGFLVDESRTVLLLVSIKDISFPWRPMTVEEYRESLKNLLATT